MHTHTHITSAQETFVTFLKREAKLGHFVPRDGVPLRATPLSKGEVHLYIEALNKTEGAKKRKGE
jgi:hypothetical protein